MNCKFVNTCINLFDVPVQYMYDFLEAVITSQTSKEEAYRKLEDMAKNQTETLSKLTKQVCTSHLTKRVHTDFVNRSH